ncbi:putative bifunctional diguanylate cyclase/phosphodiesterase [Rhizobium halophytocola]|uniref:Diguanylate cyclase (GGDEF)-like protein n=1 Tax=Rhizobium halophytocola TaxID=735519 RepID=A0ABS4E3U0_9HYPH|nr:bifunctional diguanylate cyclase/phosphodiesterase [Rhizobium halophytocola]MBP1852611.1 diguanylate cyclase (GGDEF)-like protein [Rhizobium halophytocola]
MLNILTCITVQHDPRLLAAAVCICVLGGVLTMRIFSRARATTGVTWLSWLSLSAIVGGATCWATHFIAMIGFRSGVVVGFDPELTFASLAIAVLTCFLGFGVASLGRRTALVEAGGILVGLGVAAMHYVGMAAYQVQGAMVWDRSYIIASLVMAAFFGAFATNRVARPVTRFCRYGGGTCFILTIALTHFTGMTALTVVPMPGIAAPADMLPQAVVVVSVIAVMFLIMALGASTYILDMQMTRASVERYRYMSLHDALTGLPNRTAVLERIEHLIATPAARSTQFAVVTFDLDRFKEINDVHGHAAGDHVLRVVGERLSAVLRADEFLGRVGGDEFVAVKSVVHRRQDMIAFANRLIEAACEIILWEGQNLTIGCSLGISVHRDAGQSVDDLLAQADVAMYRAKATTLDRICVYDPSMDLAARERSALAMDMRHGIGAGEFELYFQQQNDTQTGRTTGFEVLLRWNHPTRGLVSPAEFIPIAEKTGLIRELGDWVLRESCREAATWRVPLPVAVNVAPLQLGDQDFPKRVLAVLVETGLPASRLELEITETGIIADQQGALKVIRELKSYGLRIAMDDYGTGYSSLSMLQLFPFDKIKIDRGFVSGVSTNRHSAAIVRSTLILASSLDIPVLAEGVEVEAELDFLRLAGCAQVQGYYYGRPMPRAAIEDKVNGAAASAAYDRAAQDKAVKDKAALVAAEDKSIRSAAA